MARVHWLLLLIIYASPITPANLHDLSQNCPSSQFRLVAAASLVFFSATCLTTSSLLYRATVQKNCGNAPLAMRIGVYGMSAILLLGALASAYSAARVALNAGNSLYVDAGNAYGQCCQFIFKH